MNVYETKLMNLLGKVEPLLDKVTAPLKRIGDQLAAINTNLDGLRRELNAREGKAEASHSADSTS